VLPLDVFAIRDLSRPHQFRRDVVSPFGLTFSGNGIGVYIDDDSSATFSYTETADEIVITFDSPGLLEAEFESSSLIGGVQKEVLTTRRVLSARLFDVVNGVTKDKVTSDMAVTETRFNVTDNALISETPFILSSDFIFYDSLKGLPFGSESGQTRSLLTNIAAKFDTLKVDALTFNGDGTGSAAEKNANFTYVVDAATNKIIASFPDLPDKDVYTYTLVENRDSGDLVFVEYTYSSGRQTVKAIDSFVDDPSEVYVAGNIAGRYINRGSETLSDGTRVDWDDYYFVFANGTGLVEFPIVDLGTGEILQWTTRSLGICASVVGNEMIWARTSQPNIHFPGSVFPSQSACAGLTDSEISFQREHKLFDINTLGEQRTTVRQLGNTCGIDPVNNPLSPCDFSLAVEDYYPRVMERVKFLDGNAAIEPIVTFPDAADVGTIGDPATDIFVLTNDSVFNPTTGSYDPVAPSAVAEILILQDPVFGTATVETVAGELVIRYTPVTPDPAGTSLTTDTIQYRVLDQAGNQSTLTTLTVSFLSNVTYAAGLYAEFFDYGSGLSVIPSLTGRTPDVVRVDSQINYSSVNVAWSGLPTTMQDTFASRHTGYLQITTAGSYTIYVNSDDGSRVRLNGSEIINNDGIHAMRELSHTATLAAGYHPLEVTFFENGGGAGLQLSWQGPGISKQIVPASALWSDL